MIDLFALPARVMLDSSVLTITRLESEHDEAPLCQTIYRELLKAGKTILLPTPAISEYISHPPHVPPPRQRGVEVVAFDDLAAAILGRSFPPHVFQKSREPGSTRATVKYDSMIVACALRGRAGALISRDRGQRNLAAAVGLDAYDPRDIAPAAQGDLFLKPPKAQQVREKHLRQPAATRDPHRDDPGT